MYLPTPTFQQYPFYKQLKNSYLKSQLTLSGLPKLRNLKKTSKEGSRIVGSKIYIYIYFWCGSDEEKASKTRNGEAKKKLRRTI